MTSKKFNREQMQRCLNVLEQLWQSGLSTQDFALSQEVSYGQLRAWQSHAPRWRAQLADAAYVAACTTQTRQPHPIYPSQGGRRTPASYCSRSDGPSQSLAHRSHRLQPRRAQRRAALAQRGASAMRTVAQGVFGMIRIDTIWLALGVSDLRAAMDTLLARVVREMQGGARIHTAYVFANRGATRLKVLVYDGAGLWLCNRRLQQGRFIWPNGDAADAALTITAAQWDWLIAGAPWQHLNARQNIAVV